MINTIMSVRNWWLVCLTKSSLTPKGKTWGKVEKSTFYQLYKQACVGKPVCRMQFWHEMFKHGVYESCEGTSLTLKSVTECRNLLQSNRNWDVNNAFVPSLDITMVSPVFRAWWAETMVTGTTEGTVNKNDIYNNYVRFTTSSSLDKPWGKPTFWRVLNYYHKCDKVSETWNTITFSDIKTLRSHNNIDYTSMLDEYNLAFGTRSLVC
jgi:hypothetical protein